MSNLQYYCLEFNSALNVYQCLRMGPNYTGVEFGTINLNNEYACITAPHSKIVIDKRQMTFDWSQEATMLMGLVCTKYIFSDANLLSQFFSLANTAGFDLSSMLGNQY